MSTVIEEYWKADKEGVKLITVTEDRRVTYDEFVSKLQRNKVMSPILPFGTILYQESNVDKRYLIQVPPRMRMTSFFKDFFKIGFPSFVILVKIVGSFIGNVAMAGALNPIRTINDTLIRMPLPNMDDRGVLCLGWDFDTESSTKMGEIERIEHLLRYVEASNYNDHLLPMSDWIPEEILENYSDALSNEQKVLAYRNVLKAWSEKTAGENWLETISKMSWTPFVTVDQFIRSPL